MREVERWNDPASEFLTVRTSSLYKDSADECRRRKRRVQEDLNITVLVLPIDSTSFPASDGMGSVSPQKLSEQRTTKLTYRPVKRV
jgi:hypothetical protein